MRDTGDRILGTRIYSLELGDETVALISDLHLRPEEADKLAALDRFIARLEDDSTLIVLGDLFDYWVGYKQGRVAEWAALLERFADLARRGIRSFYLWGNRDYQLDAHFERQVGGTVVRGGLRLRRPQGATLLCLHGDELCQNDKSYQTAKRRLRSWPIRFLARNLPISMALKAAGKARTKSQEVISATTREDLQPSRRALKAVREAGDACLLFGHIHVAGRGALDPSSGDPALGEGVYHVLPAFEADWPGWARLDAAGELQLCREDVGCEWPGPVSVGP